MVDTQHTAQAQEAEIFEPSRQTVERRNGGHMVTFEVGHSPEAKRQVRVQLHSMLAAQLAQWLSKDTFYAADGDEIGD